jgi:hypothetical protein
MAMLRSDMVKQRLDSTFATANTQGSMTFASATGVGTSVAMRRNTSTFAVIRYLP